MLYPRTHYVELINSRCLGILGLLLVGLEVCRRWVVS